MSYRDDLDALAARHAALSAAAADAVREADEAGQLVAEARARMFLPVLDDIRTASPCSESWANMPGDQQVRECGKCEQKVFNLSAMTRAEAQTLIAERNGKLCARYFRREDGTILTADCTVGVRNKRRRGWIAAAIGASAGLATAIGGYAITRPEAPPHEHMLGEVRTHSNVDPQPMQKTYVQPRERGHEIVGGLSPIPRQLKPVR